MAFLDLTKTPLCQMSAQAQVWMLRKVRKKRKNIPRLLKKQVQQEVAVKGKRQARCGNKSFCSEVYANSWKKMSTSSPLKLFPAALRTVLIPVWGPKNYVHVSYSYVTATATELLVTFQRNLHIRYQGITEWTMGQESGDLGLAQVPQMTS